MWQRICVFLAILALTDAQQKGKPIQLNDETWTDLLKGEWLVKFYAPWCPACKALGPVWETVAGWSDDLNINVGAIDVAECPGLSGRFLVTALPTIYHVKDGEFRQYRGSREENEIISFVDDKKWEQLEPLAWYYSPTSMHMGALSLFFKLSIAIRDVHNKMTQDYGIPVWGSYTAFAVATIIAGLLLGLLIVFLCDVMCPQGPPPPRKYQPQYQQVSNHHGHGDDDRDNDSDVIEDDLPVRDAAVENNVPHADAGARRRLPREEDAPSPD